MKEVRARAFPRMGKLQSLKAKDRKPPTKGMTVKPAYCTALKKTTDSPLREGRRTRRTTKNTRRAGVLWGTSDGPYLATNS